MRAVGRFASLPRVVAPDYLKEWEGDAVLSDGATVHVRPIRPDDGERLVALHGRLSKQSQYFRFFSPKPRLTDKEVDRFVNVDFVDRAALVATLGDDIIGVARYDRWPGRNEAEVAFTVDDVHQGRGISTLLLEHLSAVARQRGITRFTAEVLPDNRPMLSVFRRAGFEMTSRYNEGVVDVAFDIVPTEQFLETVEHREHRAASRSINRLLNPRSIAVIGASDRVGSVGRAVFRNLLTWGFDGPVYPVNPSVPHVASVPAYASVIDIPDDVHVAIVAVPRDEVFGVVEQCADKRVRGVIVISTGFTDGGPGGVAEERRLVEFARGRGLRLIGPASMGIIVARPGNVLYASIATAKVRPGNVAISLQSGPLGTAMLELAYRLGVGITSLVSLGNKADVSANDLLVHWEDDAQTDVVLLYTESFGNPRRFGRIARRVSQRKPIVVVKANRADSSDVAAEALYQQAGVIRVDTVRGLFDVGRVLACQPLPNGSRVAVVANAEAPAVLAADGLEAAGLHVAELSEATRARLTANLPGCVTVGRAVDLTFRATADQYRMALNAVLAEDDVDAIIVVHAPPLAGAVDDVAAAIDETADAAGKPVLAVVLGQDDGPLDGHPRVPAFAFPESAAAVLGRVARDAAWGRRGRGPEVLPELVDLDAARRVVGGVLADSPGGALLGVADTMVLLDAAGVPFAPARTVRSVEEAVAAGDALGYPVGLKATGLTRRARSESGGVALDIQGADGLRTTYDRMVRALGVAMNEAVVQRMVPGGADTIVAVDNHPSFGPVVSFGLGGAFADAIGDRAVRALPLTDLDAEDLVRSSRAFRAIEMVGSDTGAIADVLCRVGYLVDNVPEIDGLVLNPLLVSPAGACVVDARVRVAPVVASPYDVPLRRL
jgi:acyl-CoA synthetase (NDP forming)/GNAT superfamily N-acetyltransferase